MIKEKLNTNIKGVVSFELYREGKLVWEHTQNNAIQPGAQEIIAHLLTGDAGYKLNNVEAFKASFSLAVAGIYNWSFPAANEVQFVAVFDEASFDDTLDELRLEAGLVPLDFSIITGLSIAKDGLSRLVINWKITINNLP